MSTEKVVRIGRSCRPSHGIDATVDRRVHPPGLW